MMNLNALFLGITLTFSTILTSVFAGTCDDLTGNYSCQFHGQNVPLYIDVNSNTQTATIEIDGQKREYTVDGQIHDSMNDDSQYMATCENQELTIDNYLGERLMASASISATQEGVSYTLVKQQNALQLSCSK